MSRDIKKFLVPIHVKKKCGDDLRYEKVYDDIKKARFSEDATLPQGVWVRTVEESEWDIVENLCTEVLLKRSKDLQIAAWLMEAWYHQYGLQGLIDGLKLILLLSETYWQNLHPNIKTGFRISPFNWINEKFSTQLLTLKLEETGEPEVYTFSDYKKVKIMADKAGELTLTGLLSQLKKTPPAFFQTILEQCHEALDLSEKLEKFIESKLKGQEVSIYRLRQNLDEVATLCESLVPKQSTHQLSKTEVKVEEKNVEPDIAVSSQSEQLEKDSVVLSSIDNRHAAYQKIEEIADYLQKIEPHSPTPYLLRKAIVWGQMGLQELLQEFIKSGMNLQQMQTWIGIPSSQQSEVSTVRAQSDENQNSTIKKAKV